MVNQLLLVELVLVTTLGLLLVAAPGLTARTLGLPKPDPAFWARIAGAVLLGLGAAIAISDLGWAKNGLGLAGVVAINLSLVFVLISILMVGAPIPARRGRAVLWLLSLALFGIAVVGAAWAT